MFFYLKLDRIKGNVLDYSAYIVLDWITSGLAFFFQAVVYPNIMFRFYSHCIYKKLKRTFNFNFDLYQAFKQHGYTNMETKRSCQLKKMLFKYLYACYLNKAWQQIKTGTKSRLYCSDKMADQCMLETGIYLF